MAAPLLVAKSDHELHLLPGLANRHGLIAGATGTGKTVTLQRIAEQFSKAGVPVFMADVKGDLAGLSQKGEPKPKLEERVRQLGVADFSYEACPVVFWDAYGDQGHPVRTTISELGPLLLARLLNLNDTQQGVLTLVFKIADDHGLLLLDLKDLRAMLQFVGDNAKQFTTQYGNISAASIGAIQRGLLGIEQQGGDRFFAEPALNIQDLMQTDSRGRGIINILAADKITMQALGRWLRADPERGRHVMQQNESFVFFRELEGDEAQGPLGVLSIPLVAGRSLAVDAGTHAIGTPVYVSSPALTPASRTKSDGGFHRLMIAHDVGSAIRGPERGDIYFGSGDKAGKLAGITKHPGHFFVLLPRGAAAIEAGTKGSGRSRQAKQ